MDEDYILDRFNLTGLNGEVVQEYSRALDLITDSLGKSYRVKSIRVDANREQTMGTSTTMLGKLSRRPPASCTALSTHDIS